MYQGWVMMIKKSLSVQHVNILNKTGKPWAPMAVINIAKFSLVRLLAVTLSFALSNRINLLKLKIRNNLKWRSRIPVPNAYSVLYRGREWHKTFQIDFQQGIQDCKQKTPWNTSSPILFLLPLSGGYALVHKTYICCLLHQFYTDNSFHRYWAGKTQTTEVLYIVLFPIFPQFLWHFWSCCQYAAKEVHSFTLAQEGSGCSWGSLKSCS